MIAGQYDPARHRFHNFTVAETRDDLHAFVGRLRQVNPGVRVILTVSPVPLVATATDQHVLTATTYSKAVLRAAAGELAALDDGVTYFPAYEIVTGPQAPERYFEANRRDVSELAVSAVMRALLSGLPAGISLFSGVALEGATHPRGTAQHQSASLLELSRRVAEAECDEALVES